MSSLGVLLPLLMLCALCQANPIKVTTETPEDKVDIVYRYRLPTTATPSHYKVTLSPNMTTLEYTGDLEVQFTVTEDIDELVLNSLDLEFETEKVYVKYEEKKEEEKKPSGGKDKDDKTKPGDKGKDDGKTKPGDKDKKGEKLSADVYDKNDKKTDKDGDKKPPVDDGKKPPVDDGKTVVKKVPAIDVSVNNKTEFLNIIFKESLKKGIAYTLVVENFQGTLKDKLRGFYASTYSDKDCKPRHIATTHFEPTGARLAFPCWDEPAFKATFQIIINHENKYHAISNMPEKSVTKVNEHVNQTVFEVTPKMSTYLVAFVVSDYESTKSKDEKFRVWTKPNAIKHTDYSLDMGQKVLDELDKYTEIKFNTYVPKIDQITITNFTAGAMENWGLVTYKETSLLYEDKVTTTSRKESIATVIAHEFAHQWFGNLVSPKWWTYIWLNEGFATYFQYYIIDKIEPTWRMMDVMVTDALQKTAFVADSYADTRAMNKVVDSPKQIKELFDSIAYQKSGSVIRMISHILTPEVFQAGLRSYLKANELKVADSDMLLEHFQKAVDESKKDIFGKDFDIKKLMKGWVEQPGYPVVIVKRDGEKVLVTQKRFSLEDTEDSQWSIPLTYTTQEKADFNSTATQVWMQPDDKPLTITAGDNKSWIIFNVQQTGYYRVNYDDGNWDRIIEFLKSEDFAKIHPINRAQLIDDSWNLARAGQLSYLKALSLAMYLENEKDYIPWRTAFNNLKFLESMLATSEHYPIFKLFVKHVTEKFSHDIAFEPKDNDTHIEKLLRVNTMKWACETGDEECQEAVEKSFNAWTEDTKKNPLNTDLKNNIICAAVRTMDAEKWNKTLAMYKDMSNEDEKKSFLTQMACSQSEDILRTFLQMTLEKNSYVTDFKNVFFGVLANHEFGVNVALDFFIMHYKLIESIHSDTKVLESCTQELGKHITDMEQYGKFGPFVSRKKFRVDVKTSAMKTASRNLEWTRLHRLEVEAWLKDNKEHFVESSATATTMTACLLAVTMLITRFY